GRQVEFTNASVHYYPGMLEQSFTSGNLSIRQRLIFVSGREALLRTDIRNRGGQAVQLIVEYSGKVKNSEVDATGLKAGNFAISWPHADSVDADSLRYAARWPAVLRPGATYSQTQRHAYA